MWNVGQIERQAVSEGGRTLVLLPYVCIFQLEFIQYLTFPIGAGNASKFTTINFPLLFLLDNGFIPESLLEDVMKALDLVSEPE